MVNLVLRFAAGCRVSDLPVSTAEVLDTIDQLRHINPLDETDFKTLLQANFVKTRRDRARFERIYQLFFHDLDAAAAGQDETVTPNRQVALDLLAELRDIAPTADDMDEALLNFLGGDPQAYLEALQALNRPGEERQVPLRSNLGELSNRLSVMLKINQLRSRSRALAEDRLPADPVTRQQVEDYFTALLDRAYDLLRHDAPVENAGLREAKNTAARFRAIGETPFANLTPAEIETMHEATERLVKKLKDIVSRRMAARKKGVLDIKKTLQQANRYQGVPLDICYRHRLPRKSRIVTLCDVSGSVWSAARFMLHLLYALQDCFAGVKSFIFVSGVADVSPFFQEYECNPAIDKVLSEANLDYEVPTDYGQTFREFRDHHLHELNSRTILIIIGDGRSNYMNPRLDALEEMRGKCRRLIWLNPETMQTWHTGDSEIRNFRQYCHELRPCRNLNQLAAFVEELIL